MTRQPAISVAAQYSTGGVRERIDAALRDAGKDFDRLTPAYFASFEDFHSLGRIGTAALLEAAHVTAADHVLDAGSGIGGTARLLAAEHGCRVTAIDLTDEYCDTARWLNGLVNLHDRIDVIEGDVTDLPLPDVSFDLVVSTRPDEYRRQTAPVQRGPPRLAPRRATCALGRHRRTPTTHPFPRPVGRRPRTSHLITPDKLATTLQDAGFALDVWNDLTEFAVTAMTPVFDAPSDPVGLQLLVPTSRPRSEAS